MSFSPRAFHDRDKDLVFIGLAPGAVESPNDHPNRYGVEDDTGEQVAVVLADDDNRVVGIVLLQAHRFASLSILEEARIDREEAADRHERVRELEETPAPDSPPGLAGWIAEMKQRAITVMTMWYEQGPNSEGFNDLVNRIVEEDGDDTFIITGMAKLLADALLWQSTLTGKSQQELLAEPAALIAGIAAADPPPPDVWKPPEG